MFDRRRFITLLAGSLAASALIPGLALAAHSGGRGGPPPGKGPSGGSDHHDDHDSSHDLGHEDETDDETHDDSHAEGGHDSGGEEDEGKRGPRYKGGRSVANLKGGFGHSFTSESVIFRH